jgi:membrane protease YdiL (CAAX protease family)
MSDEPLPVFIDRPPSPAPPSFPEAPEPLQIPFWDWRDAALFAGMAIPGMFLFYLFAQVVEKAWGLKADSAPVLVFFQTLAYLGIFGLLALMLRLTYDAPFWRSMGWLPSTVSPAIAIAYGISIAFAVGALGGVMHVPNVDSPVQKLLKSPHGGIFLAIFGITVAPLAEELLFRGFLQPLMIRSLGAVAGIGLTSVLFGVMHLEQNARVWQIAALISMAGAAFGFLRYTSGSIRTSIITHASYNGTLFFAYFLSGKGH